MFYGRRKRDNQYIYYISGESVSFGQLKNAIPFDTTEQAHEFKNFAEKHANENCEIVSVVTTISIIEQPKEETIETPSDED